MSTAVERNLETGRCCSAKGRQWRETGRLPTAGRVDSSSAWHALAGSLKNVRSRYWSEG